MENGSYFGTRRKRNIDLSRFQREEYSSGINWGNNKESREEMGFEEEIVEGIEEMEVEEAEPSDEWSADTDSTELNGKQLYLNGKLFKMKSKSTKQSFTETHVRITTYLEKNVHQIIHLLQKQGQIDSITKIINDSVKEYLINHYQDEKGVSIFLCK